MCYREASPSCFVTTLHDCPTAPSQYSSSTAQPRWIPAHGLVAVETCLDIYMRLTPCPLCSRAVVQRFTTSLPVTGFPSGITARVWRALGVGVSYKFKEGQQRNSNASQGVAQACSKSRENAEDMHADASAEVPEWLHTAALSPLPPCFT